MKKSTLLHLRIPFSFLLMPVFLFAVSVSPEFPLDKLIIVFVSLHLFLYPASNGYNSWFDKDEESIGGLKTPPKVEKELLYYSLLFDALAVIVGFFASWQFALMCFIYGAISRAYSNDKIRLKKYPIVSWLAVTIFQGGFMFLATYLALNQLTFPELLKTEILFPAALSTAMLMGSYPMTQVYQHEEDEKRGDLTLSRMLGIKGTFIFTVLFFACAMAGFTSYFTTYFDFNRVIVLNIALLPVLVYFLFWFRKVWFDKNAANFSSTMRLNIISATCFNLFFFYSTLMNHFSVFS
ncbi:MAG: ubiquinone biosynthesis protein UbiA [Thalassobius sp.]|nr:ubiquinone biosynthesis protein UbiA [Thalassovita sp.]